jgi:hypothetical protein
MKTKEEWAKLAIQMNTSGMTQKAWCEAHGINISSMRNSIKRRKKSEIKTASSSSKKTGTTESWIEAVPIVSKNTSSNVVSDDIQVMTDRYVINVPVGFDRATFIDICKAISAL